MTLLLLLLIGLLNLSSATISDMNDEINLRSLDEMVPYGVKSVHADVVSPAPRTAHPVTLCVVDSGIFRDHNDFPAEFISGDDSVRAGQWDNDVNGHGTHVAGILAAQGNNGVGTRGIIGNLTTSNINLHITRSHGANGAGGLMSDVLAAVIQCRQKGAKVINLSVGCNNCYSPVTDALFSELYEEGTLVVAAAGNDGSTNKKYPASYKGVVSVGSVTYFDSLSSATQTNDQIEFTAPGSGVYSTSIYQNRYTTKHGTSMASPHVSGVAALVWSHYPNCSAKQIRNVLAHSARDLGTSPGCDMEFGFGVPEADKALDYLSREGCEGVEMMLSGEGGCDIAQLTNTKFIPEADKALDYLAREGCEGVEMMLSGEGGCDIAQLVDSRVQDRGKTLEGMNSFEEVSSSPSMSPKNNSIRRCAEKKATCSSHKMCCSSNCSFKKFECK
eukprot:CAMPEP_0194442594 /NCGR_PEP_ID=MMETSP0176-20130528/126221_1 /TAXON_ID=216777 /ORGANISM="Proboscia alata, Strain PI-D3" /LENGTH=443 /DNA_ID=CAMNT_0039268715 /DNA_START=1408 /DNA_END=2740 /DNA_ORIENTATION=+